MAAALHVPADDFPCDTAAVLGATIKNTHHHHRLEAICVNNAFFYSKSCPFSADIIGLRVLTWYSTDFALFHVSHSSLSARSAAAANSVRADFGVFRWRVITLRFYTEICLR